MINPITNAEMNVVSPVIVKPTFSEMPSWTRFRSAVMQLITSPVPSVSKNAMFWRMIEALRNRRVSK